MKRPPRNKLIYDEKAAADLKALSAQRVELSSKLTPINREIQTISADLGALVADGGDYTKAIKRRAELRLEAEALEAGLHHINALTTRMRELHPELR